MLNLPETIESLGIGKNINHKNKNILEVLKLGDYSLTFKRIRTFEHFNTEVGKSIIYDSYINGSKVGNISLINHDGKIHINGISVEDNYQRKGIALKMIVELNDFLYKETGLLLHSDKLITVDEAVLVRKKLVKEGLAEETNILNETGGIIFKMKTPSK